MSSDKSPSRFRDEGELGAHIFPKTQVAANKNVHTSGRYFLAQYSMPFHMV